jgi:hypothetical protein
MSAELAYRAVTVWFGVSFAVGAVWAAAGWAHRLVTR